MNRLYRPAWIARHLVAVGLVLGFLWLGRWQWDRAVAGNMISWGYALQWPAFAAFVVAVWWREVRRALAAGRPAPGDAAGAGPSTPAPAGPDGRRLEPPGTRRPVRAAPPPAAAVPEDDPALAEYNRYLAWLHANPGARPADYPG